MSRLDVDVAIAGSGFAGSILAAILQRNGLRVALIDRARHPRFAIGESSTPTANLILRDLADRYDLDWLRPLSQYGTWKQNYPHLTSGIKRGFAYFWHEPAHEFLPTSDHRSELLVAASSSDDVSDTQWLRSEVDAFLFERACDEGARPFESTKIESLTALASGWKLECHAPNGTVEIHCRFLVDGTGAGGLVSRHLQILDDSTRLRTNSRTVFGHFADVPRWSSLLNKVSETTAPDAVVDSEGTNQQEEVGSLFRPAGFPSTNGLGRKRLPTPCVSPMHDHPFDSDHSALHHLLLDGWMWWLRFDNDVTSVGLVVDGASSPPDGQTAAAEFASAIERVPDLKRALNGAKFVAPSSGLVRTGRLQRLATRIAGPDWAMLPHTAGFIDPLHSSGIAHSLSGVERLAGILIRNLPRGSDRLEVELRHYSNTVRAELLLIDRLASGCYSALRQRSFRKFVAWSMCYFAAATSWERRRVENVDERAALFLADDPAFIQTIESLQPWLETQTDAVFAQLCEEGLAPFNHVGLFHPPVPNMYARTAVPDSNPNPV
ncbi:hypothetical protein GC176_17855 [bacterium]|nr:hypothetical protein [bacterium]